MAPPSVHKNVLHLLTSPAILRVHDNSVLSFVSQQCDDISTFSVVALIDQATPFSISTPPLKPTKSRAVFTLQSLTDLSSSLTKINSKQKLLVMMDQPSTARTSSSSPLVNYISQNSITLLLHSKTNLSPSQKSYTNKLFKSLKTAVPNLEIKHFEEDSNLHPMDLYISKCKDGVPPLSYGGFRKIFDSLPKPRECLPTVSSLPPLPTLSEAYAIPTLADLGYTEASVGGDASSLIPGGETEAIKRLNEKVTSNPTWVSTFSKPNTAPNSLEASTTMLSPYLANGCLSPRSFYHELTAIEKKVKGGTQPPVSLKGQLLWREYNYLTAYGTPHFGTAKGNPVARDIDWDSDEVLLAKWREGKTGFPFIDAIMRQLAQTGWIHHLARHAVACFLTRGDLYQSWEAGARVFDEHLVDADWSINNLNWQWLSCTAHFHQYFRCYSPVAFGKKTDPNGDYIKKWIPELKNMPKKFIYEPWKAPALLQIASKCVIGKDYPKPMVEHSDISKTNMERMKVAFEKHKNRGDFEFEEEEEEESDEGGDAEEESSGGGGKRRKMK
jgi:cryptochrome